MRRLPPRSYPFWNSVTPCQVASNRCLIGDAHESIFQLQSAAEFVVQRLLRADRQWCYFPGSHLTSVWFDVSAPAS